MFFPHSQNAALQAEVHRLKKVAKELTDKIISLQTDRRLSQAREAALLELIEFYNKEMSRNTNSTKTLYTAEEARFPSSGRPSAVTRRHSYALTSPDGPSLHRWPSPALPISPEPDTREDILSYLLEGWEAVGALHTLSASSTALSLVPLALRTKSYQVAAANLEQIPILVSDFAGKVASLRSRCLRSQDLLVPRFMESFMVDSTNRMNEFADQTQPGPGHPPELSFRFYGLPNMLEEFCRQSWCLGHQSKHCLHRLSPGMNKSMAVVLVHPGGKWIDFQRCLFAGLKGATVLKGETFSLAATAHIREPWSHEFLDEESWENVFQDTDKLDVFWEFPGDSDCSGESIKLSSESDISNKGKSRGEISHFPQILSDIEEATSEPSDTSPFANRENSEFEARAQAEEHLTDLALIHEDQTREPEVTKQAESALSELDFENREPGYRYLRAGEGHYASRNASFISTYEEPAISRLEPPRGPYPYLRRGDGLRRSIIPILAVQKPSH